MKTFTTTGKGLVAENGITGVLLNPNSLECEIKKIRVLEHGKSYEDFSISIHKGKWTKNYVARLEDENVSENVPVRLTLYKRNKRATRHVTFKASANVSVTVDKKRNMLLLDVHDTVLYTDGTHRYNTDLPEWFDKP